MTLKAGPLDVRSANSLLSTLRTLVPGLAMAALVATVSRIVTLFLPLGLNEVLIAIWVGLLIATFGHLPAVATPGLRFAQQRILRLGIILLGARLSLFDVAQIGAGALALVLVCMTAVLAFVLIVGRLSNLPRRLILLIGVGTAVCGNSAILATAPVVKAEEREVSFAVATITLFGTLALFLYPLIGGALHLSDTTFGIWAGVAINDTSQVIAASAAYSPVALDAAAVVKLVRNTLMAPLILLIALWWSRSAATQGTAGSARDGALKAFPLFVLGFLAMALLRTVGLIDAPTAKLIDEVVKVCILVALAAVGLSTRLGLLWSVGPRPFLLGLGASSLLAALSLAAIVCLQISSTVR
jgi:uncharacterized integral membrane protein (TIGR00698 family)